MAANKSYLKATLGASLAIILAIIGLVVYENSVAGIGVGTYLENGTLTDTQTQSISITLDLIKTLMAWVAGVIGATAFFLKLNVEQKLSIHKTDLILSFTIIVISVVSLFFGHLAVDKIAASLSLDQYPMEDSQIRQIARLQYVVGLSAVALFGFHVFQFFWARLHLDNREPDNGNK